MVVQDGVRLTLSELFWPSPLVTGALPQIHAAIPVDQQADLQWRSAIAALNLLLEQQLVSDNVAANNTPDGEQEDWQGVCLSSPTPVLTQAANLNLFQGIATASAWRYYQPQLAAVNENFSVSPPQQREFPLFPQDPLTHEQFCLVATSTFSLLIVLGRNAEQHPYCYWTFDPHQLTQAWQSLRFRWQCFFSPDLVYLDALLEQFSFTEPHYQVVSQFSQLMLQSVLGAVEGSQAISTNHPAPLRESHIPIPEPASDIAILKALTHEIRTPLTSIQTLTRLLLRRRDLTQDVSKRIEAIDRECQEQISRMDLIFRATEIESGTVPELVVPLMTTELDAVFKAGIPRWQRQAKRYQVDLQVEMPQALPLVWSNPHLLDQVLSGLIEQLVRSLRSGGQIQLQVTTAGEQLKVQFYTRASHHLNPLKALGELLMFQPETGCLSLNWDVTKNLFQLLGGRLTIKRRSPREEMLTIYLPVGSVS